MVLKMTNNAVSTLASSITAAATSLSVQAADAAKFPALDVGDWHPATLLDSSGNMEIVKVTARNGSTLTVLRAQEGTTAKAFAAGSRLDVRLTAFAINDFIYTLGHHQHETADINGLGALIQSYITALVDSSPAALDTLKELAAALGNDPNFATTMATALGDKYNKSGGDIGGRVTIKNTASYGLNVQGLNTQYQGVQAKFQTAGGTSAGFGPKINFLKAGVVEWNFGIGDGAAGWLGWFLSAHEGAQGSLRALLETNGNFTLYDGANQATHTAVGEITFSGGMTAYGSSLSVALSNRPPFNQATARDELNVPLGSILGCTGVGVERNVAVSVFPSTQTDRYITSNQGLGQMAGTWRSRGFVGSGNHIVQRVG